MINRRHVPLYGVNEGIVSAVGRDRGWHRQGKLGVEDGDIRHELFGEDAGLERWVHLPVDEDRRPTYLGGAAAGGGDGHVPGLGAKLAAAHCSCKVSHRPTGQFGVLVQNPGDLADIHA